MLRDLTLTLLVFNAGLLIYADKSWAALLLLVLAFSIYFHKVGYSHLLDKELSYLGARLSQILTILFGLFSIAVIFTQLEAKTIIPFYSALSLAATPLMVHFVMNKGIARSESKLGQYRIINILRCALALCSATTALVIVGLVGFAHYHLLPAISVLQVLLLELALGLPIYALRYDKPPHKPLSVSDRNLRIHTIGAKSLKEYFIYGSVAASLAYANYILLFKRHDLDPTYLDPTLPMYRQAVTLSLLTVALCFYLHLFFERSNKHEFLINEHTLANKKLLKAIGLSLLLLSLIIYTPVLRDIFELSPLDISDWLMAGLAAIIYFGINLLKRHNKKHSRHAIIKLHKEFNIKI